MPWAAFLIIGAGGLIGAFPMPWWSITIKQAQRPSMQRPERPAILSQFRPPNLPQRPQFPRGGGAGAIQQYQQDLKNYSEQVRSLEKQHRENRDAARRSYDAALKKYNDEYNEIRRKHSEDRRKASDAQRGSARWYIEHGVTKKLMEAQVDARAGGEAPKETTVRLWGWDTGAGIAGLVLGIIILPVTIVPLVVRPLHRWAWFFSMS